MPVSAAPKVMHASRVFLLHGNQMVEITVETNQVGWPLSARLLRLLRVLPSLYWFSSCRTSAHQAATKKNAKAEMRKVWDITV